MLLLVHPIPSRAAASPQGARNAASTSLAKVFHLPQQRVSVNRACLGKQALYRKPYPFSLPHLLSPRDFLQPITSRRWPQSHVSHLNASTCPRRAKISISIFSALFIESPPKAEMQTARARDHWSGFESDTDVGCLTLGYRRICADYGSFKRPIKWTGTPFSGGQDTRYTHHRSFSDHEKFSLCYRESPCRVLLLHGPHFVSTYPA